jgi:hypothetical protein
MSDSCSAGRPLPHRPRNLTSLPPAAQALLRLFQRVYHGRVEDLAVRAGLPVLSPPPRVHRDTFTATSRPKARSRAR